MFQDREWRVGTSAFQLTDQHLSDLNVLGDDLLAFVRACDGLYRDSVDGRAPGFVARWLDQGKPRWLLEAARAESLTPCLPDVLRPDLLITDAGFVLSEIDSVPGGIGLTAWLNQTYARLGEPVIGGEQGMIDGFRRLLGADAAVVVSRESGDYLPEMQWLAHQWQEGGAADAPSVVRPWELSPDRLPATIYRFFELWDHAEVEHGRAMIEAAARGDLRITAPPKPWLEEKLWLALFHLPALETEWRDRLPGDTFARLRRQIPFGWVLDPEPLPAQAEYPRLGVQDWSQVGALPGAERRLVLKISGFSERGWGSRGVVIGHDRSQQEWSEAIDAALEDVAGGRAAWLLQEFHSARAQPQAWFDDGVEPGIERTMDGRTRLCPYYFVEHGKAALQGALATVCPADKKIIHGMSEAVLLPCKA